MQKDFSTAADNGKILKNTDKEQTDCQWPHTNLDSVQL